MIEGRAALRDRGNNRDHSAEVAGPEAPHVQVKQLIAGGIDRLPYLLLNRVGRTDIEQNRPVSRIKPYDQLSSVRSRSSLTVCICLPTRVRC